MRARGIVLDATLSVGRGLARARPGAAGFADPAAAVRWSHEAIRAAAAAGVTISAGSDTGMNAPDALHAELALLIEAGLTPMQAIVAATQGGARALGRADELGTIQPGRLADLVVLRRDPTADIEALRDVALVIKSGTVHEAQPRE
jgi:imidazolonepropionase-like amidohydrolase